MEQSAFIQEGFHGASPALARQTVKLKLASSCAGTLDMIKFLREEVAAKSIIRASLGVARLSLVVVDLSSLGYPAPRFLFLFYFARVVV